MSILDKYQKLTNQEPCYPEFGEGTDLALSYIMNGLTAKCGQLIVANSYEAKMDKLGNILWYVARYCEETGDYDFKGLTAVRVFSSYDTIPSSMIIGLSNISISVQKRIVEGTEDEQKNAVRAKNAEFGLINVLNACFQILQFSAVERGENQTDNELLELVLERSVQKIGRG